MRGNCALLPLVVFVVVVPARISRRHGNRRRFQIIKVFISDFGSHQ
jgi:hypothetical protein